MGHHLNFQHSFSDVIEEVLVLLLIIAFELLYQLVLFCVISECYWKKGLVVIDPTLGTEVISMQTLAAEVISMQNL
jgi:hypothetical protein